MKYYISVFVVMAFIVVVPTQTSAGDIAIMSQFDEGERYDLAHSRTYQVEGNSMKTFGFAHDALVTVVPAVEFRVGDVIAFECNHDECDGAYIKKIVQKQKSCYWLEGRNDVWEEDNQKRQSLDSRTTYGWLCDDDIDIYGVAFLQDV
ncbi:MAG: S24 family peptidase [Patescibacteria group bacterium]|nr:S24 family peptidase [Patescibacteria group bacterium]